MLTFEDADLCRVTNQGDSTIILSWNSRKFQINPGEVKMVPVFAAITAFGDPRSVGSIRSWKNPTSNEVGWVPDRAAEVRRLRAKYAILEGNDQTLQGSDGSIPLTVPDVRVEYMEGGEFVYYPTVIDDPEGNDAILENSQSVDIQTLQASLEKTQRQLAMLIQAQGADLNLGGEDDIPTDDPEAAVISTKEAKSVKPVEPKGKPTDK